MNNKILSAVLLTGIAASGFAGISAADDTQTGSLTDTQHEAMHDLMDKLRAGETLTDSEQAELDELKSLRPERGGHTKDHFGKRKGFGHLTDEERTALESMSDEEKQAFFETKKAEMEAQKAAYKAVIDALIAGETLSTEQETLRAEMITRFEDEDNHHTHRRDGGDVILKLLQGETLTADEQTELADMQARHAEREAEKTKIDAMTDEERQAYFEAKRVEHEAQREALQPIMDKLKAGETLTDDEQAQLDAAKDAMSFGK